MMMVTPHWPYQLSVGLLLPLGDFCPMRKAAASEADVLQCTRQSLEQLFKGALWRFDGFPKGVRLHVALTTYLLRMARLSEA